MARYITWATTPPSAAQIFVYMADMPHGCAAAAMGKGLRGSEVPS